MQRAEIVVVDQLHGALDQRGLAGESVVKVSEQDGRRVVTVVEPYLLQLGFLDRTPRGRVATRRAYDHLQIDYPDRPEQGRLL